MYRLLRGVYLFCGVRKEIFNFSDSLWYFPKVRIGVNRSRLCKIPQMQIVFQSFKFLNKLIKHSITFKTFIL